MWPVLIPCAQGLPACPQELFRGVFANVLALNSSVLDPIPGGSSEFSNHFSLSSVCIATLGLSYPYKNAIGVFKRKKRESVCLGFKLEPATLI